MANDTAKSTQSRREARKARRAANETAAELQDQELLDAAKRDIKAPEPKAPRKSRKELVTEQREQAAREADKQALARAPEPDIDQLKARGGLKRGANVPLHVLNAMANQHGRVVRSEARDTANIVGKAAFQHLTGKRAARENKFARMRDAIAARQKADEGSGQ